MIMCKFDDCYAAQAELWCHSVAFTASHLECPCPSASWPLAGVLLLASVGATHPVEAALAAAELLPHRPAAAAAALLRGTLHTCYPQICLPPANPSFVCGRRPCESVYGCILQPGALQRADPKAPAWHLCLVRAIAWRVVTHVSPLYTCRGARGHACDGGAGGGGRRAATGGAGGRRRRAVWRRCAPAECQLSFSVARHLALHKCAGAYRLTRLLMFA
jgi:hypothetical protein